MVKNFCEWKQAVDAECSKLREVEHYLNDSGLERYRTFATLANLASFCASASELVEWIGSKEEFTKYDIRALESGHASSPIRSLKRIANQE